LTEYWWRGLRGVVVAKEDVVEGRVGNDVVGYTQVDPSLG